jgi:hypothetical protein
LANSSRESQLLSQFLTSLRFPGARVIVPRLDNTDIGLSGTPSWIVIDRRSIVVAFGTTESDGRPFPPWVRDVVLKAAGHSDFGLSRE